MMIPNASPSALDVAAVVPDLFFAMRIETLLQRSDRTVVFCRSLEELQTVVTERRPILVLVDLGARSIDVIAAIRQAKAAEVAQVIVFGPHKDLALRAAARDAGADRWVTNQSLLATLTEVFGTTSA